jgi:hypothetical protein
MAPVGAAGVVVSLIAAVICFGLIASRAIHYDGWPKAGMSRPDDRARLSAVPSPTATPKPEPRHRAASRRPVARRAARRVIAPRTPRRQTFAPRVQRPVAPAAQRPVPGATSRPSSGGTAPAPAPKPQPAPVPVPQPQGKPEPKPREVVDTAAGTIRTTGGVVGGVVGTVSPPAGQAVTGAADQAATTAEGLAGKLP